MTGAESSVHADTVLTRDGSQYEGAVRLEALRVAGIQGEVEVPHSAIREIRGTDTGVEVVLTDGTSVIGVPAEPDLRIEVGLIVRMIPFAEIELVSFGPGSPEEQIRKAMRNGEFAPARLASPEMGVLETACPLRLAMSLPTRVPNTTWRTNELRPFVCDEVVSIPAVIASMREPRRGVARLLLDFHVLVQPPQDKLSRLGVELLLDGESVAKGGKARVSTEEGRTTTVRITLDIQASDYERWRAGVEKAILKLTLAAVDD
jgi:hypothetical protein